MVEVRKADGSNVADIIRVCEAGYRETYKSLLEKEDIEQVIEEFYNADRIAREVRNISDEWNGWFVAVDEEGTVVGAGGGGMTGSETAELFVLYLDPERKREGIGGRLLEAITEDHIARGASEQWVSVTKGNEMGIPFYEKSGFVYKGERPSHKLPSEKSYISLRYRREIGK
ncbi:GNAT family N-acetyltransferase [Halobacillus sp. ACCC02827]|uniref:GNAT family N-acetyltransferase n=1 Tax=Halobacillus sp. ACCC02827 TaxID=3052090 RepID=UPI002570926F|nr:GNAT family N-acetyltransferase [Halobacillus sp. ACCC02827]WJE17238.1 GNAT family N-acetyltransferase [Halobacillus sp. ACCC02827]